MPESVLEPLKTVLVAMKHMQSMFPSMTPVKRYSNPTSGCESYMLAVHSELPNSIPLNVPKPLEKLEPLDATVGQSYSETVYPRPIHQISKITESAYPEYPLSQHKYPVCPAPEPQQARSGMNSKTGSGSSGDNGNGNDVGTDGGKCSDDSG
ncbi:hypothetical protein Tco_0588543, partial [Tanacetum coccineum]